MLSKKMEDALNAQINAEFWSAYLYLSMSSNFAALGNPGFANWFSVQFKEGVGSTYLYASGSVGRKISAGFYLSKAKYPIDYRWGIFL